jgi:hypothetical protein
MADWCGGEERGVQPVLVDVIDRKSERPIGLIRPTGRFLSSHQAVRPSPSSH